MCHTTCDCVYKLRDETQLFPVVMDRATSSDRLGLSQKLKQTERLMSQRRNKALQEYMHEKESVSERGGLERD